ncbi:MAG TPA: glycosyltransferase family 9 protein [Kineosporiaceae bacterium]|nr:glycosyltransferase family 9 protein [Kineosporiaceae bacterium]
MSSGPPPVRSATLVVRLDSDGDVLLAGPAVRALSAGSRRLDLLVSRTGAAAAELLPGVDEVLEFDAPWSGYQPPPVDPVAVHSLVGLLASRGYDLAVVLTSYHQSPLPMALLARLAGIGRIVADSCDYPGALLDVRHQRREVHEVQAGLDLAEAAGCPLPAGDDGRLALIEPLPDPGVELPTGSFVVVHPGASVPSRALAADHAARMVAALVNAGWEVAVTGGPNERDLAARAAAAGALDLSGQTTFGQLASVLKRAACVVVGNTGPAHLAAAVGTPVVSLFSPVVPIQRWAPHGVASVLLGDQDAGCRGTRARDCPLPGHPCLSGVDPIDVVAAVAELTGRRADLLTEAVG